MELLTTLDCHEEDQGVSFFEVLKDFFKGLARVLGQRNHVLHQTVHETVLVGDLEQEELRIVVDIANQQVVFFCRVCGPIVCGIRLLFQLAFLELGSLYEDFVPSLLP